MSSHKNNERTLNEVTEIGPNLLPMTFAILLRFRLHSTAIISNITQAFLQMTLGKKGRDFKRFFCHRINQESDGHYHSTDFTWLPFSLTCRPFLLSTTLREHDWHKVTFLTAAILVDSNTFMDDFTAAVQNVNGEITT